MKTRKTQIYAQINNAESQRRTIVIFFFFFLRKQPKFHSKVQTQKGLANFFRCKGISKP